MRSLEGANCGGLPAFVIDKYFDCNAAKKPLHAKVALAICGNCVVREQCRAEALDMANLPRRGVIGGVKAIEINRARTWRRYEQGLSDHIPKVNRPEWLPMPDAAHDVEHQRLKQDPDEPDHPPDDGQPREDA